MSYNIYKILFLISATRINRKGLVPIICRITYKNERKPFATGLFIKPNEWYSKSQLAKPPNEDNNFINAELSLIKNKINQAFLFLQVQGVEFDVEDIYKQYKGESSQKQVGIIEFYSSYLERLKKMIGKDFKESTWEKFNEILPAIKDYIFFKYQKKDMSLVNKQLQEIKKSGQLLLAMPVIRQLVEQNFADIRINHSHLSKIEVNYLTYQIFLPQYKNLEVKLSYLTKAVYLLFYENADGINLLEIKNYRDQLFNIYSQICPFDDLDKIKKSIDDITNIDTKAIYTHISRIKSAFLNLMDYEYAKNYIVTGNHHGATFKFIQIMKNNLENPFDDEGDECNCFFNQ